jgi:hypothetical protein
MRIENTMRYMGQLRLTAIAAAVVLAVAASQNLAAQTAPTLLYHAAGTFANVAINGDDLLELAGEPFNLSISASEATKPGKHGSTWALYSNLTLTGVVHSGFNPQKRFNISSAHTQLLLSKANAAYDEFKMTCPVTVVGVRLTVVADVHMPKGTLAGFLIKRFTGPVTLNASNITISYSRATPPASTLLGVSAGSLTTSIQP